MNTQNKATAILIFAQSAAEELLHKKFSKNPELFQVLNRETLSKVQHSGLPYFHFSEKEQTGNSFGERFVNAIQEIYDMGFDNVITIGNDSPQLKTQHLLQANTQLLHGKTVLGPTTDGGFYLMGLQKQDFSPELFIRLPWQRFSLFQKISQLLAGNNSCIYQLPLLHDIDTKKDVGILLNFIKSVSISLQLIFARLTTNLTSYFSESNPFCSLLIQFNFFNKGSPYSISFH
ncbi:TIGR04282 family arsenosugar biosynthesis glycosyltransferase [Croceitalea rosinachiae]|uniref:DUF2064 domain-containing protein n=1 Tax=Croceitalea rosinachiae TaxID=3075596 RepID=A0ABU3A8L9_9FLAO|nr:DUF2064 domain-containing protein [Croceitalea sp. F388]MDT0606225.1 DUF2064 domain-containing protein [Croceitalea sp. F388]